jgi:hypothetical protein
LKQRSRNGFLDVLPRGSGRKMAVVFATLGVQNRDEHSRPMQRSR